MIEKLIGLAATAGLASVVYVTVPTALDTMSVEEFAAQNGVSQPVLDCATDVLADRNAEELVDLIENDVAHAGTDAESETVAALRECVMIDPLGWSGTAHEEHLPLLREYLEPTD